MWRDAEGLVALKVGDDLLDVADDEAVFSEGGEFRGEGALALKGLVLAPLGVGLVLAGDVGLGDADGVLGRVGDEELAEDGQVDVMRVAGLRSGRRGRGRPGARWWGSRRG